MSVRVVESKGWRDVGISNYTNRLATKYLFGFLDIHLPARPHSVPSLCTRKLAT